MRLLGYVSAAFLVCGSAGCPLAADNDTGDTVGFDGDTTPIDSDGDGFSDIEDCNDDDPEVSPAAEERCDGVDNDCDGLVDDDDTSVVGQVSGWYDGDRDGYGSDQRVSACEFGDTIAQVDGDCDDRFPNVNPSAPEVCDRVDNDCDGLVDAADDDISATLLVNGWTDLDGDGFGTTGAIACANDPELASFPGDCDDTDARIHPDADEACDTLDNDCDDLVDDDDPDRLGGTEWYLDNDEDGYGAGIAVQSCVAPAGYTSVAGDCEDEFPAVNPGQGETECNALDDDCDGMVDGYALTCGGWEDSCDGLTDPACTVITADVVIATSANVDPNGLTAIDRRPDPELTLYVAGGGLCVLPEFVNTFGATWSIGCAFELQEDGVLHVELYDMDAVGRDFMNSWTVPIADILDAPTGPFVLGADIATVTLHR